MKHILSIIALLITLPAHADSKGTNVRLTPLYKSECGSCHAAFPPALMGKTDWQKTMAGLDRHFGTDASLDEKTRSEILAFLERNAGHHSPQAAAEPRLTATSWFKREHREVPAGIWKDSRVKSATNCTACHQGAEQGRYGEREIAIPGLQRRHEED